jgi:hypothetical protein
MEKAKVFFTSEITPQSVIRMYNKLNIELPGKVAVKLHSGEAGNQNFMRPEFVKPMIEAVGGTVVECNTAYEGQRNTTAKHVQLMKDHGWSRYFFVDIIDAEGPDMVIDVPNGKTIQKTYVGKNMVNYDSMLVLSHFKGHPMGGYGGALKQLSIGCGSSFGKAYIHGAGNPDEMWTTDQDKFLESMADAAYGVAKYFEGKIAYVSVMCNLSVDCDCCAEAEDPCMKDIGVLSSLDPVALDQACIDLIYASSDPGRDHFIERVETRHGIHTIESAAALGLGSREYELINVD